MIRIWKLATFFINLIYIFGFLVCYSLPFLPLILIHSLLIQFELATPAMQKPKAKPRYKNFIYWSLVYTFQWSSSTNTCQSSSCCCCKACCLYFTWSGSSWCMIPCILKNWFLTLKNYLSCCLMNILFPFIFYSPFHLRQQLLMRMLWPVGWPMPQFHHLSKQLLSQHQPYLSLIIKVNILFLLLSFYFILKKCAH